MAINPQLPSITNGVGPTKPKNPGPDLKALTSPELSAADQNVRKSVVADQGPQALLDSAGQPVQLAALTPGAYWAMKLVECSERGISAADCRPWS